MSTTPAYTDAAETWNRRYAGDEFLFGTEPNAWLREHAHAMPQGARILSVADGEGRNSVWLARQGFQVDAFDVADRAVVKARALARREGVSVNFTVADVDGFQWLDAAFADLTIIELREYEAEVREGQGHSGQSALIGLVARR